MSDRLDDHDVLPGRELLFQRSKQRAYQCLNDQQYSRAFAHLIVALTIQPDVEDAVLDMFLHTLDRVASDLEVQENWNELFLCYERSLEILPYNSHILHGLATALFRLGHIESATCYFKKAYKENPFFTPSLYCIDNIKNSLVERWHFAMLNDKGRNSAYSEAINRAVKDGYGVVLDIGAGTGILSMIAADAGAEKVYACEGSDAMFRILQKVVESNSKSIQLLQKFSFDFVPDDLQQKVMLVVTEIFDAGLFGEDVLRTLKHAWENLIENGNANCPLEDSDEENDSDLVMENIEKPRVGKVIPHSATLWAVPIECERIRHHYWLNEKTLKTFGIDNVSVSATVVHTEPYTTERLANIPGGYKYLCSPKPVLSVNFNSLEEVVSLLNGKWIVAKFEPSVSGKIDAVAVWFDLNLDEFVKISTGPENESGCWEQSVFCVLPKHLKGSSQQVKETDVVEVMLLCKGHLTLQSVEAVTSHRDSHSQKSVSIDSFAIQCLNSYAASSILSSNFLSKILTSNSSIIDISSFPVVGLKALKDGADKLTILPSRCLRDVYELLTLFNIPHDKLKNMCYEDICAEAMQFSALIVEPVEMYGLLRKNIFEDIALMRTLSKVQPLLVFPRKIGIFVVLVESPALFRQAKLVSDEHCMGYKISQFLNIYQTAIHQDLQLSTLPCERLCGSIKLCDIELDKLHLEKNKLQSFVEFRGSTNVVIKKSGKISAIPFWFNLSYDEDNIIDTSCPELLWKQAAIIPETEVAVCDGSEVTLEWTCRNSCLNISVKVNNV